jgi:integrase
MSVYKSAKSPYWQYDFEVGGHRFFGSTKRTTRREAEAVERTEREKAERHVKQAKAAATSLKLDDIAGRYWQEVGQHHAGAHNTERQIGYLIEFFGKDKLITDVTDDDITKLVAWRRGHRSRTGDLISAYTVNDTSEQLRQLIGRCKLWGIQFAHEPRWRRHKLTEPQERVRELVGDEGERLQAATRDDYAPFFAFARASGLRLKECYTLTWSEVDFGERQVRKIGKGGKLVTVPITPAIRQILWLLRGHHPDAVFTYVAQRDIDKTVKGRRYHFVAGERYPITLSGVSTEWRRLRKRAGVQGFRFHDHRHDLGTKILRDTGNLKLVQKALNHSSIRSTVRYAHVLDEDVAEALDRYQTSRKNPRNLRDKKVS